MRSERFWISVFGCALAGVFFGTILLLNIPLLDPDEGLHASIAQEMVERGDFVTPSFLGKAFYDKPILFFWAQAFSLWSLGMNEAAVRLPGLMFGLLGAITTGLLGSVLFGRRAGILAGFFQATLVLPTALAQAAVHDVALVPWTNLAILSLWRSDRSRDAMISWRSCCFAGVWLGLAVLTKGLIGVAFVCLSFGLFWLYERRFEFGPWTRLTVALLIAACCAAPWFGLMSLRNPGYAYYYFIQRHVLGYLDKAQPHGMTAWWYYLPILLGGGVPWVAYLPTSLQALWNRRTEHEPMDSARIFVWIWFLGSLTFLTLACSKLLTYMLPLFPAIALLAADVWSRLLDGTLHQHARRSLAAVFWGTSAIGPLVLPVSFSIVISLFGLTFPPWQWGVVLAVSALGWAPIFLWRRGWIRATLVCDGAYIAATFILVLALILPTIANAASAKELANHFNAQECPLPRIVFLENRLASLVFYLRPELRARLTRDQFQEEDARGILDKVRPAPDLLIVVPDDEAVLAEPRLHLAEFEIPYERVGRFRIYESRNMLGPKPAALSANSFERKTPL